MSHRITITAASLLLAAVMACAAEPSSPRDVYDAYVAALKAGDTAKVKTLVVGDAKRMPLIDDRAPAADAEKRYRAAIDKAFPTAPKLPDYGPATTRPEDQPDPMRVVVKNDIATLTIKDTTELVRLRQVNGAWKIDLNAMYSPETVTQIGQFRGALTEVMNALAAEIDAGRFKRYDDVVADLDTRVKMRIATPDLPATTRPTP